MRLPVLITLSAAASALVACQAEQRNQLANRSEETAGNAPAPNRIDKPPLGSRAGADADDVPETGDPRTR
jgi:hypothetical protein